MQLFLDSACLEEIEELCGLGIIDGVTTNPSLIAKENVNFEQRITDICHLVKGPVSAEVISTDSKSMLKEAEKLIKLHKQVVIKVPLTQEGIRTTVTLSKQNIQTNVTLCFSASQALLAAKAGATFVSPFIGRLDDVSYDGLTLIEDIQQIYTQYNFTTQIIAASIRHPLHIRECAKIGVNIATSSYKTLKQLFEHPFTKIGLNQFLSDWKSARKV